MAILMTLDEILLKIPEAFRPIAKEYGPALVIMSADDIYRWILLLVKGDTDTAFKIVVKNLNNTELINAIDQLYANINAENVFNKQRMDVQKAASIAVLKVLLSMAMVMVGL